MLDIAALSLEIEFTLLGSISAQNTKDLLHEKINQTLMVQINPNLSPLLYAKKQHESVC